MHRHDLPAATQDYQPVETYDLVGGALCFDFANTASGRLVGPFRERLVDYDDLLVWSRRTGLLSEGQAAELAAEAARRLEAAEAVIERARALREGIHRIFSALVADESPLAADVAALNAALAEAGRHRRVTGGPEGWTWTWARGEEPLAWPLHPVAQSAAEVLTEGEVARVKQCASEECAWLFYDVSRNRSRRWCEMKDCGNKAKQREFRRRAASGGG
jgi:predicted RNA-binding Zn ribbon-like protein